MAVKIQVKVFWVVMLYSVVVRIPVLHAASTFRWRWRQ